MGTNGTFIIAALLYEGSTTTHVSQIAIKIELKEPNSALCSKWTDEICEESQIV